MPKAFKDHAVVCERCGETFWTKANNTKFCPACRHEVSRIRARERARALRAGTWEPRPPGRPSKVPKPKPRPPEEYRIPESKQLCWTCRNAVPDEDHGCRWSIEFRPIPGWTATKTERGGWSISACPKYVQGR